MMLAVSDEMAKMDGVRPDSRRCRCTASPAIESRPSLLWDGEWEVTWVTFRDMGGAFGVALVGIYLLVVAQFGSFRVPLIVLTPVPLTLVGIVLGHWAFGAPFTATSMIGFIALAGIIVRNPILLVDFIRHSARPGASLREIVLEAGAIRIKPIVLTAAAAMIGAAFILADPIFQGLAISLLFGLAFVDAAHRRRHPGDLRRGARCRDQADRRGAERRLIAPRDRPMKRKSPSDPGSDGDLRCDDVSAGGGRGSADEQFRPRRREGVEHLAIGGDVAVISCAASSPSWASIAATMRRCPAIDPVIDATSGRRIS